MFFKIGESGIVARQRYEGVREYFSGVWEAFVVQVVRFGERGAKQGEVPVGNWRTDLNEIMAYDAQVEKYVVEWSGAVDPSHGRHRGVLIINCLLNGVCVCMLVMYYGKKDRVRLGVRIMNYG